jgi:hypothetical protein
MTETGGRFEEERRGMARTYQDKMESLEQENKRLSEKIVEV